MRNLDQPNHGVGAYWHLHHDRLIELAREPIENRIRYIRENKPANEIELRLRLLQPVRGYLPPYAVALAREFRAALAANQKARATRDAKWGEYQALLRSDNAADLEKIDGVYDEYAIAIAQDDLSFRRYDYALKEFNKYVKDNEYILALHKKECPNCPWDGQTIFPEVHNEE